MVYFDNFEEFFSRAKQLLIAHPDGTRYSIKVRHSDQTISLKVTDDKQTFTFKTDQQSEFKKIEMMNTLFTKLMSAPDLNEDVVDKEEAAMELELSEAADEGKALPQYIKATKPKQKRRKKQQKS